MTSAITIEGKVLGQRKPLFPDWVLPFPTEWEDADSRLHLRDLITRVVLEEVDAFRQRQAQRRLLHVLTPEEIARGTEEGRVAMGGQHLEQEVDPQAAVLTALQAFEDGLYFIFVDGQQRCALDEDLQLDPDSRVTFVRLVPLAGG
jgi:hypothetical protein